MEIICSFCNKKFLFRGGKAHFNRSKTHFCSMKCLTESHIKYGKKTKNYREYILWCGSKKRAKQKGIEFNLTFYDMPKIPKICPVLGIKIKPNNKCGPSDNSPSLDRIDCKKGYVIGNIRIISNRANRLRQDGTIREWKLLIKDAKSF